MKTSKTKDILSKTNINQLNQYTQDKSNKKPAKPILIKYSRYEPLWSGTFSPRKMRTSNVAQDTTYRSSRSSGKPSSGFFFENLHIFIFKLFTEFHVMHTLPLNVLVFAYFDANSMTACCAALGVADFDIDIHSNIHL